MDYAQHVDAVERENAAVVDAFRAGRLDVQVPTCPDWVLGDLLDHLIGFSEFWIYSLQGNGSPRAMRGDVTLEQFGDAVAASADPGARIDRYESNAATMVELLRGLTPSSEAWTWVADDQTAGFVARRAAHELAIHRYDAQAARGKAQPIDAALAADGIDEIFALLAALGRTANGEGETLHLHGAEGDEWMITIGPERLDVRHEHGKGDLALRGAVSDLELVLYSRPPIGDLEQFGDSAVLDVWRRAFTFG